MLSKLLASHCRVGWRGVGLGSGIPVLGNTPAARKPVKLTLVRQSGDYIPPTQYDIPISYKFHFIEVMKINWELIPIFVTTAISLSLVFFAFVWAAKNKVDVVWHTHSRDNISRTMDLRNPEGHKVITIHQRYEPWPEMADALDRIKYAEKRWEARQAKCYPK